MKADECVRRRLIHSQKNFEATGLTEQRSKTIRDRQWGSSMLHVCPVSVLLEPAHAQCGVTELTWKSRMPNGDIQVSSVMMSHSM